MTINTAVLDTRVMVTRSVRRSFRDSEAFFTALMLPVILMLMFVYVFGGAMNTGGDYVDYVVPGLLLLCAGFGAGTTSVSVAQDMSNGIVDRFRSMPIHGSAVMIGHIVASIVRNLIATTLVVGVALLVGWRPNASPLEWLASLGVVLMFILAISWLAATAGLLLGSPEAANGFSMILMFLPYVSTAFVPADTMPSWMRGFAEHQPLTPIIETLRGLWMGTPIGDQAWIATAWCIGVLIVSVPASAWLFGRRTSR